MQVDSNNFTAMKGHVIDGCVIRSVDGSLYTLKSTMTGWCVFASDGTRYSDSLNSAMAVECFVVNNLS